MLQWKSNEFLNDQVKLDTVINYQKSMSTLPINDNKHSLKYYLFENKLIYNFNIDEVIHYTAICYASSIPR